MQNLNLISENESEIIHSNTAEIIHHKYLNI